MGKRIVVNAGIIETRIAVQEGNLLTALYVERHVYVGHSYNASQILSGAVPYEDGVLVFSSNRVSTDQVAGLGGELKRGIGRRQLRSEIVKRFDRIRAALIKPTAPPERVESP